MKFTEATGDFGGVPGQKVGGGQSVTNDDGPITIVCAVIPGRDHQIGPFDG
ncbi:MAG: hypothetical protein NWS71_07300 [Opitutales bacterium]|nr:hypothetical protein [Opitutales bacterium]